MPKSKKPQPHPDYQRLRQELDEVLAELQREDLDVDKALEYYERGLVLAKQLEKYLATAENKIRAITIKNRADGE